VSVIAVESSSRLIGQALVALLEQAGFQVVAGPSPEHKPDLAVVDLRAARHPYPPPPENVPAIALVSGIDSDKLLVLKLGYRGYLHGNEAIDDLRRAINTVISGQLWAERRVLETVLLSSPRPALTEREHQVLSLLVEGQSNKKIAQRLGTAEKTVKVYVSSLLEKFDAKNRQELAHYHRQRST
jgi:DNA-binding NarL/FixJ family response regulator